MKDKLNEITEYMVEDVHNCMTDVQDGNPGAEAEFFRALQRLDLLAKAQANLGFFYSND